MSKRITIMLEDEVAKKLRVIQSQLIRESPGAVSFSYVINQQLKEGLKRR